MSDSALIPHPESDPGSALRASQPSGSDARIEALPPKKKRRKILYSREFLVFWAAHPKPSKKIEAASFWEAEQPVLAEVLAALEWQKRDPEMSKDGFKFFPGPAPYIHGRRWEDEPRRAAAYGPVVTEKEVRGAAAVKAFLANPEGQKGGVR